MQRDVGTGRLDCRHDYHKRAQLAKRTTLTSYELAIDYRVHRWRAFVFAVAAALAAVVALYSRASPLRRAAGSTQAFDELSVAFSARSSASIRSPRASLDTDGRFGTHRGPRLDAESPPVSLDTDESFWTRNLPVLAAQHVKRARPCPAHKRCHFHATADVFISSEVAKYEVHF